MALPICQITDIRFYENKWSQSGALGIGQQCDHSYDCVVTSGNVDCNGSVCACEEGFHATKGDCVQDVKGMFILTRRTVAFNERFEWRRNKGTTFVQFNSVNKEE
jgi:hypothetical protein